MIYDYQNCLDYAREKGLAEGRIEGVAEGEKLAKIETAKNLKNKGIATEIISECTGLLVEEIRGL